jgi:hypothetical protein
MHLRTPLLEFGFILEATVGSGPNKLGIKNEGFAEPSTVNKEPCSPFYSVRIWVLSTYHRF